MQKVKKVSSNKKKAEKQELKWYTYKEVFGKISKNKQFQKGYREETSRLKLAKQVRDLRNAKHMTQKVVAQRSGMPQSVIARIESGEHGLSVDTLNKVATALGKEVQLV